MNELETLIKLRDKKVAQLKKAEELILKAEEKSSRIRRNAISKAMQAMEKDLGIDAVLVLIDKYVDSNKDRKTLGLMVYQDKTSKAKKIP